MNAYFKGQPVFGLRGPAGPDGNPIGTIISYMGLTAPEDYLICDGAEYSISDYPGLADFFRREFGDANHFGGDGETTFVVPDLRNLFLRGFHGEAKDSLSGEVGQKQEATIHRAFYTATDSTGGISTLHYAVETPNIQSSASNSDGDVDKSTYTASFRANIAAGTISKAMGYTSRPVNAAVLYCIKAVDEPPWTPVPLSIQEYDTEDGWHVRKWSSGYVEMSKAFSFDKGGETYGPVPGAPFRLPVVLKEKYSEQTGFLWISATMSNYISLQSCGYSNTPEDELETTAWILFHSTGVGAGTIKGSVFVTGRWK